MSNRKHNLPKRIRKHPARTKYTESFEDCTVTVQGSKVWLSGPLADELANVARQAGMTIQEVCSECLRSGLPMLLADVRAKRNRQERVKRSRKRNDSISKGLKTEAEHFWPGKLGNPIKRPGHPRYEYLMRKHG